MDTNICSVGSRVPTPTEHLLSLCAVEGASWHLIAREARRVKGLEQLLAGEIVERSQEGRDTARATAAIDTGLAKQLGRARDRDRKRESRRRRARHRARRRVSREPTSDLQPPALPVLSRQPRARRHALDRRRWHAQASANGLEAARRWPATWSMPASRSCLDSRSGSTPPRTRRRSLVEAGRSPCSGQAFSLLPEAKRVSR